MWRDERATYTVHKQRAIGIGLQLPAENLREPGLVEPLFRDANHRVVEFIPVVFLYVDAISLEESERGSHGGPFIAIDEGLILSDVKGLGSRDCGQISLGVIIGGLRLHQGRVQ
jgi:hypothetical protein